MRPTLQTVADVVGVSRSTVSNAYSKPDQLSPELRERILDTARDLGYAGPNPAARSLRKGRVGAIGILFSATLSYAFTDPYAVQFLRGVAEMAERHETGLLLMPLSDGDSVSAAVDNAVVDGFCIYCLPDWHASWDAVRARNLPIVVAERRDEGHPDARYVGIDEAAATRNAGRHITGFGHRQVALIADWIITERETRPVAVGEVAELPYYVTRERFAGYRDALTEAGIDWSDVLTINAAQNSRAAGAEAAAYALDRSPRATAIMAVSDQLALGVLDALAERGLQPGRDVSVVGFDDIADAAGARLTTISQPALEKGRIAGGLLLDPPDDPAEGRVVLPTRLVVRASTGPAPH
ncbi:LacI family DNA-binding transcriptional regulator [Hamadaea tsunoensis]|uniref:LacI family DNA-binding transcriptional regulator n=1 Tax=Hamadaea tsunoensis TaxID=53368 RepID=UPI000416D6B0|nr:LacI family DNA-binding transcriptional regulator [Hamadaea tsunoensis]